MSSDADSDAFVAVPLQRFWFRMSRGGWQSANKMCLWLVLAPRSAFPLLPHSTCLPQAVCNDTNTTLKY